MGASTMSGNSYTLSDQGAHVAQGVTCTAGACRGREGNAYGCNAEQRATMAELGLTLETAPKARGGKDEWEDALIKHKVMDAPLDHAKMKFMLQQKREDEAFLSSKRDEHQDATLEELEAAIDEDAIEADLFEKYRAQRLTEMRARAAKEKFGSLMHLAASDYVDEVTQAPTDQVVVLHLYQDYVPECARLNDVLQELSHRHKAVKFCKIKSNDANAGYPDEALPTLMVYQGGNMLDQVTALKTNGGHPVTVDGLEWRLAQQGFVKTELEEDPFKDLSLTKMRVLHGARGRQGSRVGYDSDGTDSDYDSN